MADHDLYLGTGYPIDKYPSLAMTPFYVVKDMWNLNEIRCQKLRRYGIENARTTDAHRTAKEFLDHLLPLLDLVIPAFRREGKRYLTIAIGCTGGKHRSVALTEEVARHLRRDGDSVQVNHRDRQR